MGFEKVMRVRTVVEEFDVRLRHPERLRLIRLRFADPNLMECLDKQMSRQVRSRSPLELRTTKKLLAMLKLTVNVVMG